MKRRGLTITLAVLLAVIGTAGVLVYVKHANARALAGQRAVTVVIAKSLIPSGTSAGDAQDQGLLETETLPAASVPADALTAVTPAVSALVTDADLQPGQLLLRPMLVTAAQVTDGLAIPSGMVAVSILFCVPEAVAGNLHAGSQVAVFDTVVKGTSNVTAQAACSGPHQSVSGDTAQTKLILPKVTVLSVGSSSASGQGGSQSGGALGGSSSSSGSSTQNSELVTVAVSQNDAERVIALTEDGLPYLALVNASSGLSTTTTGISAQGH
jgi:pilus assembly protein CpaB